MSFSDISGGAHAGREQARHAEIDIEALPVQAKSEAENLDLRQLCVARPLQSLRAARRKSKAAPIGEIDMDTPGPAVIPDCAGTRVRAQRARAAPFRVRNHDGKIIAHEFYSTRNRTRLCRGYVYRCVSIYFDIFYVERDMEGLH